MTLRMEIEKLEAKYGITGREGFKDALARFFVERLEKLKKKVYVGKGYSIGPLYEAGLHGAVGGVHKLIDKEIEEWKE